MLSRVRPPVVLWLALFRPTFAPPGRIPSP